MDDDTDLLSRLRVRTGEMPQVMDLTRARIGRDVLRAMNGDISKLRLQTSGGLLTATSLEQGPLLHGNFDEENPTQKAFNGTLHRRRAKPLVGVWFLEVDPDGYVWLRRIWDSKCNAVDDVYEVFGVEPPRGRTTGQAIPSRSKSR